MAASGSKIKNGPWLTDPFAEGQGAGIYSRMTIALTGTLVLNRTEAIYFSMEEQGNHDAFSGITLFNWNL